MSLDVPVRTAFAATLLLTCGPAWAQGSPPSRTLGISATPGSAPPASLPLAGAARDMPPQTALPALPPPSTGAPMRVTTDTAEYCEQLSQRVHRAERPAAAAPAGKPERRAEVEELVAEGHEMCATGLIRGGLLRLRRAWMLLRAGD